MRGQRRYYTATNLDTLLSEASLSSIIEQLVSGLHSAALKSLNSYTSSAYELSDQYFHSSCVIRKASRATNSRYLT